jgi:hypothetical protein
MLTLVYGNANSFVKNPLNEQDSETEEQELTERSTLQRILSAIEGMVPNFLENGFRKARAPSHDLRGTWTVLNRDHFDPGVRFQRDRTIQRDVLAVLMTIEGSDRPH